MTFISNIQSVAKYESKLLIRSWFFRVFTVLAVTIITFFNFQLFVSEDSGGFWIATAIPSNIPYLILLLLNTGQAVIAIFLASDFLKRDKKLDTSEVFYVRPLSNAEYVIGKIWGNLRVFLLLNLIIMAITAAFNLTLGGLDGLLALFSVDQCPYADFHYWPGYLSDAGIEKSGTDIRFIVRIYRTYRFLY